MAYHKDCIHWAVCSRACPINTEDCQYYVLVKHEYMGKWEKNPGGMYECSNCNIVGDNNWYYCPHCGSFNADGIIDKAEWIGFGNITQNK